jgi:predicted esterase
MAPSSWILVVGSWLAIFACFTDSRAQDDVADITSQDLRAGKDEAKRYFLIDPPKGKTAPKTGYGLLLVLPGGAGDAGFLPFVKRINKYAVPERFLVAQLVAPKWTDQSQVVWPTAKSPVAGIKFSTEEFVDTVIDDVTSGHHIDPELIFTLSWSSGGPAAYAVSLTSRKVTGSFIAMSVFKPDLLPPLERAEGRGYFLYHSREDRVCPFRMAELASNELAKNKAKVKLVTYEGGHGWKPGLYDEIKDGIRWLETHHAAPPVARQ